MDLLERQSALSELMQALGEAHQGSGRLALIGGEAGIGKTALVERFRETLPGDVRFWWGACDALFAPRPLGPLFDMAPDIGGAVPGLLTSSEPVNRLYSTLLVELQNRPTVVVIEDVQWIDEATLDLLRYLTRRIARTSALVLLTYRDDEWPPEHPTRLAIETLAHAPECQRIHLAPLSVAAVRALTRVAPHHAQTLHALTGGNPFFVNELALHTEGGIPPTVRDALLARIARLSGSGQAVLRAAAVLGPRIERWALATVTGAEAEYVSEGLGSGFLIERGEALAFRHELARQIVLESTAPTQRCALHRLSLFALRADPATRDDLTRLAHHAEGSAEAEWILQYAPAAARQAADARTHRAAALLFELALSCAAGLDIAERAQLWLDYSVECDVTSRRPDAMKALEEAHRLFVEAGLPLSAGLCLSRQALLLQITGRVADAARVNSEALALLEPLAPNRQLISAYNVEAWLSLASPDQRQGIDRVEKALALAEHFESEGDLPRLFEVAGLLWLTQDRQRGLAYLERALAAALKLGHATRAANIYTNLALLLVDQYAFDQAQALLDVGLPFAQERDLDFAQRLMSCTLALLKLHRGDWATAERLATEELQRHPSSTARGSALLVVGRLRARRGDPDALTPLEESLALLVRQGFRQLEGSVRVALAEAAWNAGDRDRAATEARAGLELALSHAQPWYVGELAYWLGRAGQPVEAPDWAAEPFALEMAGDWSAAADAWAALDCPYERARALANGDITARREALAVFVKLGAKPAATELRDQLRSAGIDRLPHGPRAATRRNPLGLTRRQADVLDGLLADLTNAEIAARLHLSVKTVEKHVGALLARFGVRTRQGVIDHVRQLSSRLD